MWLLCIFSLCAAHSRNIFYYKWFSFGVFIFTIIRIVKWTIAAVDLCYKYKIYGLFNLDKFWPVSARLTLRLCSAHHTTVSVGTKPVECYLRGRVSALKCIRIVKQLIGFNGAHTRYGGVQRSIGYLQ